MKIGNREMKVEVKVAECDFTDCFMISVEGEKKFPATSYRNVE